MCRLVRYSSPDLAARAIIQLNGQELDGRKLHVREDRTYIESAEGVVIFVVRGGGHLHCEANLPPISQSFPTYLCIQGNLPWSVTTERLADLFRDYNPLDVHVKTNMAGRSRGEQSLHAMPSIKCPFLGCPDGLFVSSRSTLERGMPMNLVARPLLRKSYHNA